MEKILNKVYWVAALLGGVGLMILEFSLNKREWMGGALLGILFGEFGLYLLVQIIKASLSQQKISKGRLSTYFLAKLFFILAALFLVLKIDFFHPFGFLVGYGCVLLALILISLRAQLLLES